MNIEQMYFEWSDDYSIGVKLIDDAHRQLFSLVSRIIRNVADNNFEKNRMTCIEAVKYLKTYTVKHFAEEEEYQRSVNYEGYRIHKAIHDNMRDVVVPNLEEEMKQSDYSMQSVEHFVGVCAGWLLAHVLIEDQAITGKVRSKWRRQNPDDVSEIELEAIMTNVIASLFQSPASLVSRKYTGHELDRVLCCNDEFTDEKGAVYSVTTAIEESVVKGEASKIMCRRVLEMDDVMLPLVTEVIKSFNAKIVHSFISDDLVNIGSRVIKSSEFYSEFENVYPDYTMLWQTSDGYIAFCLRKKPIFTNNPDGSEK